MGPKKSVEVKFFTVAFLEGAARHQMVPGVIIDDARHTPKKYYREKFYFDGFFWTHQV